MRVGRLLGFAASMACAAIFIAGPEVAHADIPLASATVNIPPTPVSDTVQVTCGSTGPGTLTITVWLNGAPEVGVTLPWILNPTWCRTNPVTIGEGGQADTATSYIQQPYPEPCAITVAGGCIVSYPVNPATDSLIVEVCQGTSCTTDQLPLAAIFTTSPLPTVAIP